MTIDAETDAYRNAKDVLKDLTDDNLNDYIYYISLMDKNNYKLLIGAENIIADVRKGG